jgi:hypothetical protein
VGVEIGWSRGRRAFTGGVSQLAAVKGPAGIDHAGAEEGGRVVEIGEAGVHA